MNYTIEQLEEMLAKQKAQCDPLYLLKQEVEDLKQWVNQDLSLCNKVDRLEEKIKVLESDNKLAFSSLRRLFERLENVETIKQKLEKYENQIAQLAIPREA